MKINTRTTFDSVDHSKENEIHLVTSLTAPETDWKNKRAPIAILPVIDISGSMDGEKLDYAKKSVIKLIDHLKPGDYCGLVAFGSDVHPISELVEVTQYQKDSLKASAGDLGTSGMTNFSGGMRQALEWINNLDAPENTILRVIMFTDGMANVGEATGRNMISLLERLRGRATLSAFGYGSDADQELLADLATAGKGNYAFVRNPDDAMSAFARELGGLVSVYAQDITVDIGPQNGHEIKEVISDVDVEEDGKNVKIKVPEILAEEERNLVISMNLSEQSKALPRAMNIADVKVSYDCLKDGNKEHIEDSAKSKIHFVKSGDEQKEPNEDVMGIVGIAKTVKAQIEAEEHAEKGDFSTASAVLMDNSRWLESFNLHTHADQSRKISDKFSNREVYTENSGFLRSYKRAATRSVEAYDDTSRQFLSQVGASATTSAQDATQKSFAKATPGAERYDTDKDDGKEMPQKSGSSKKKVSKSKSNRW